MSQMDANARNEHFEAQGRLTDVLHQELQSAQVYNRWFYLFRTRIELRHTAW